MNKEIPDGDPLVSFIGTRGDIEGAYAYGGMTPVVSSSPFGKLSTSGNIIYSANEKRTIVTSSTGNVKIIAGFQSGVIQVGTELEQGFIVQSTDNEAGVHSGEVAYTLEVNASGWINSFYPVFTRTATINGAFYGVGRD